MSLLSTQETAVVNLTALPSDYFALLKPRVMSLVIFTALTGMVVAPTHPSPFVAGVALLAIALGAGASGALNMWYDADIDAIMSRTQSRPIPSGRITPQEALTLGVVTSVFSVLLLGLATNWFASGFLAFTIFFYVVVYTMGLKRSTPQNIVIGGAAGAFPPMVGFAAMTGSVSALSLALFAIIFIWTPPHFWALALVKSEDYQRAGIPMMPNAKGEARTRCEILAYTALLAPTGLLPFFLGSASWVYAAVASLGGLSMLILSFRVFRLREGKSAHRAAWQLFGFSIFYLTMLFAVLLIEHSIILVLKNG